MFALLLSLAACTGAPVGDTAPAQDTDTEEPYEGCETLEIRVDGEDPPQVGDTWTVLLICDDAVMTGALRVIWDPPETARTVDDTGITYEFMQAGDATLTMQSGSQRVTRDVTVLAAE